MADGKGQSEGQALLELQEKLDTYHVQIDMVRGCSLPPGSTTASLTHVPRPALPAFLNPCFQARMKQQRTVIALRRAALTLEELKGFGGEVPMFKPVGKA
jgi:hypothetical protein